jgi:hypothetical protein
VLASNAMGSTGSEAAYGPRKIREIKVRRFAFRASRVLGLRSLLKSADYIEFSPAVCDAKEFSDLCTRVNCYLGDIDLPLYLPGARFELDPASVPYMEPDLVRDPGWVAQRPKGAPYLLVHRTTPASLGRLLSHRGVGASVVDPDLYALSELEYWRVRERLAWPNYPSAEVSMQRLHAHAPNAKSAFVLATGPSALTVDLAAVDADVRITCNSAVRDIERLRAFRPTIIAFTDPVFHFGPCRYAAAFRRDLLRAIEISDPLLLCGSDWVSPLLNLMPELEERLAVVPFRPGGRWRWPTKRDPTVRATESVLTNLMLPVAFMLADRISVAGVDGRQPTENYFWKHGLQYSDELMASVFDAHPAFFRDRDYEDHYENYCGEIENFLQIAERAGKAIVGAAPSWIPAFRKRGAQEPVADDT